MKKESGVSGVSWDSHRERWVVQVRVKGKNTNLGRFKNLADAVKVRVSADKKK
jgi:hypothetical protein